VMNKLCVENGNFVALKDQNGVHIRV
jgi:hypothetical protein